MQSPSKNLTKCELCKKSESRFDVLNLKKKYFPLAPSAQASYMGGCQLDSFMMSAPFTKMNCIHMHNKLNNSVQIWALPSLKVWLLLQKVLIPHVPSLMLQVQNPNICVLKKGGEFKQEIEFQLVDLVAEEGTLAKTVSAANLVGLITTSWRLGGWYQFRKLNQTQLLHGKFPKTQLKPNDLLVGFYNYCWMHQ